VEGGKQEQLMDNIANAVGGVRDFNRSRFLHIVFASTSGHTEYVVDALIDSLKGIATGWEIEETLAEKTQPHDFLRGDVLLLASATWNTGSIEGQLNPHMWMLLQDEAKNPDLASKPCAASGGVVTYNARGADSVAIVSGFVGVYNSIAPEIGGGNTSVTIFRLPGK